MAETRSTLETKKSELEKELTRPDIAQNSRELSKIGKELQHIERILSLMGDVTRLEKDLQDIEEILSGQDFELRELAQSEQQSKQDELETKRQELGVALVPPDPQDGRNVIIEIRAGAGGDEAGLFAAELYRMYIRYAEAKHWKVQSVTTNRTGIGGYKEVIFEIHGTDVYADLKFESGVHRVQRVPETEKSGRVHTSTVTVAIIPIVEEADMSIKPEDVKVEATTSTGHGGQSVNTTYSAIRATHIPTGITVSCQNERSQKQNKEKAFEILRSRVFALEEEKKRAKESALRKNKIGTGDRSEKIRTYNFPQDRLTDHRIKQNFHGLSGIMDGDISRLIETLKLESQKAT
ncbi:MAG: peptide chain release factor 1 [Patescibacteria group bacterium]|jgi:peptide chain release factor 1